MSHIQILQHDCDCDLHVACEILQKEENKQIANEAFSKFDMKRRAIKKI